MKWLASNGTQPWLKSGVAVVLVGSEMFSIVGVRSRKNIISCVDAFKSFATERLNMIEYLRSPPEKRKEGGKKETVDASKGFRRRKTPSQR